MHKASTTHLSKPRLTHPPSQHNLRPAPTFCCRASSSSKRDLINVYSLLRTMASWLRTCSNMQPYSRRVKVGSFRQLSCPQTQPLPPSVAHAVPCQHPANAAQASKHT